MPIIQLIYTTDPCLPAYQQRVRFVSFINVNTKEKDLSERTAQRCGV